LRKGQGHRTEDNVKDAGATSWAIGDGRGPRPQKRACGGPSASALFWGSKMSHDAGVVSYGLASSNIVHNEAQPCNIEQGTSANIDQTRSKSSNIEPGHSTII